MKEEDGIEATDEQVCEIIKNFEKDLQDNSILSENELETVSGGGKYVYKTIETVARTAAKMVVVSAASTAGGGAGALLGAIGGGVGSYALTKGLESKGSENVAAVAGAYGGAFVGGVIGMTGGAAVGAKICKAMGL